jgi:ATP-independent RNA helicase DbpA
MEEMGAIGRIELMQGHESPWASLAELTPVAGEALKAPMRTLQIVGGRKEKIRPGDVLGAMTGEAGFSADQIGKINVNEFSTYVAVDRSIAATAVDRLSKGRIKGKTVRVRLLDDSDHR